MLRVLLVIATVIGSLWLMLALNVLPTPLAIVADYIVTTALSLACPLFFLSLWLAPGLYHEASGGFSHFWERIRTRRDDIEDLQRKIAHLDKPHHMAQLGQVYYRQGRLAKAAEWFERSLAKDSESLDTRYRLGLCRYAQGLYEPAAELLEQVHAVRPDYDYGLAYLRLAQTQHHLGNLDRAAEVYRSLLKFYPAQPEGSYHYALLLAGQADTQGARQLMQDAVFSVRHSPRFHRRRNRHWMFKAQWWLMRNRA